MRFTLRQIAVFVAVAQAQSVSRAAQALAMSQSAASTALGELERLYSTQLFDRVGKTLRVNEQGSALLPQAVELLDRAQAIDSALDGRSGYGMLRVGATLTIGNYLAPLILADYLQRHAQSSAQLLVRNTATIVDEVATYELDLGLIEGECAHPELVVEPWIDDELALFCAPGHPLAGKSRVRLTELSGEAWIVREPGSGTRQTLDRALAARRATIKVRLELEHTEAIKRAVESGLGIGCASRLALREAVRRGSLKMLETPELDLMRRFNFVWPRRKFQTAGMRAFVAACRALTAGATRSDQIDLPFIA
jgi:DNA-binding transcriptional LysR family regulator